MAKLTFTLEVEMIGDWHIGSGDGRHRKIDSLVERDHDGLPYVRAGTIRGIWRDALQTLAYGLDAGVFGDWGRLVEALLGSEPVQSRLHVSDARLAPALRSSLVPTDLEQRERRVAAKTVLREALTFVKPGVGIDPRSGRAKKDFLRFEEVARSGAVLHAKGEIELPDGTDATTAKTIAAFLTGGAMLAENLGGKRRRGMGECTWAVTFEFVSAKSSETFGKWPEWAPEVVTVLGGAQAAPDFAEASAPSAFDFARKSSHGAEPQNGEDSSEVWLKIPLRITLLSPLLVADEVQGNVVTCQDFIPGGYLLPPIAARLKAELADPWPHIIAGDIRVLPATPELSKKKRGLPIPFCWEKPKGSKDFKDVRVTPRGDDRGPLQYTPLRSGFVTPDVDAEGKADGVLAVEKVLRTHNTIKDDIQRPDESIGGVYGYEALASGQVFRSEVWIRGSVGWSAGNVSLALEYPDDRHRVGRARTAGYGDIQIKVDGDAVERDPAFHPSVLRVWLQTDAVPPPHAASHGGLDALAGMIAAALGKQASDLFDLNAVETWGVLRPRRIDTWQTKWGLPRPTLAAFAAGSVAEFALNGSSIDDDDVKTLEREGIGVRKGEGFGCLTVNHPYLSAPPYEVTRVNTARDDGVMGESSKEANGHNKYLGKTHRRAWERCIEIRAEAAVSEKDDRRRVLGWDAGEYDRQKLEASRPAKPNMAQLGGLRVAMGDLTDLARVKAWLDEAGKKRRGKWPEKAEHPEKCPDALLATAEAIYRIVPKVGDEPATLVLSDKIWKMLKLDTDREKANAEFAGAPMPPQLAGFDPLADKELRRFAIRALLLNAMRFHKRDIEAREREEATL